ncbi:hypothetical protein GCM10027564_04960 [Luteimonas notoginsengisoli]
MPASAALKSPASTSADTCSAEGEAGAACTVAKPHASTTDSMQVASRSRGRRPIVADGIDSVRTGWIKVKYTPLPAPLHLPTVTAV